MSTLDSKLQSLGLTDKEVAVYLALLNLGPSTAQDIALRANVNRATTYVMIEMLVEKGMVSQITKQKKTLFQAEDPIELLKVLENQKNDLDEKMGQARLVIPNLQQLYNLNRSKISVRLLEGSESIKIIQNELLRSKVKSFDTIVNWSQVSKDEPLSDKDHRRPLFEKDFVTRAILTYDPKKQTPHFPFIKGEERRMIPHDKFPVEGEVILYDNKMAIINKTDKVFGIVIEDESVYKTYKAIFELAWEAAEKYKIK